MTDSLVDLKRAFTDNQAPDLERDLAAFIADHPIYRDLPQQDQKSAARNAAIHLLLSIRSQSIVGLVR
jgi:hypothetical protein